MDNEFVGASENPGEVADQSPSQGETGVAADSGSRAQKPVDWTQDPKFREFQSERDRREAQLTKRLNEIERQVRLKEQEAQMYRKVLTEAGDEDVSVRLAREAELLELRSKAAEADQYRAQLEAQARAEEWKQSKRDALRRLGFEVTPEFEGALTRATTNGDDTPVFEYIARQSAPKKAEPPQAPKEPKYTDLPPGGGVTSKDTNVTGAQKKERILSNLAEAQRRGNQRDIARLMAEAEREGIALG